MELPLLLGLAAVMGATLGLLGGGGSILTVPLLLYVAKMEPKVAIASSLLVVGMTSLFALWPHARAGFVRWKTGFLFGAMAMVGAFGGGAVAQFVPANALLLLFAAMMLAAAVAMLREGKGPAANSDAEPKPKSLAWIAVEGIMVGALTGMIGAGGGFIVVPVLVLLGGLGMREAIGTSLLVIAMKSFAGFAGYASHVSVNYPLVAAIAGMAIVGAFAGVAISKHMSTRTLRMGFGWFVVVMGLYILGRQLPESVTAHPIFHAVFEQRWPWYVGGLAIGGFVLAFLYSENKLLGVSTGYSEVCSLRHEPAKRKSWRLRFLPGMVLGGLAAALISQAEPTLAMGAFDQLWGTSLLTKAVVLIGGGMLVGFGARTAGGCTSGHSIVGVAQGAKSSLIATVMFMIAGFAVTNLVVVLVGGAS